MSRDEKIRDMLLAGHGPSAIGRRLQMHRDTVAAIRAFWKLRGFQFPDSRYGPRPKHPRWHISGKHIPSGGTMSVAADTKREAESEFHGLGGDLAVSARIRWHG